MIDPTILFTLMTILALLIALAVYNIEKVWGSVLFLTSGLAFAATILISFGGVASQVDYEVKPLITSTPKLIIVETSLKDFQLTNLSDREILTAKKFYVRIHKNSWGIEQTQRTKLTWSK